MLGSKPAPSLLQEEARHNLVSLTPRFVFQSFPYPSFSMRINLLMVLLPRPIKMTLELQPGSPHRRDSYANPCTSTLVSWDLIGACLNKNIKTNVWVKHKRGGDNKCSRQASQGLRGLSPRAPICTVHQTSSLIKLFRLLQHDSYCKHHEPELALCFSSMKIHKVR